jgi:cellulose synthase (UDP-forming)
VGGGWLDSLLDQIGGAGLILLCGGGFWLALLLRGKRDPVLRALMACLCILLAVRYAIWRIAEGLPGPQGIIADTLVAIFVALEMLTILSGIINLVMLSRTVDRSPESDEYADHPVTRAPVDVFIASYNEGRDILERTLIAACAIDHPDLRVWMLDDGNRPWVKALAEELGAHYVFRIKGKHAKAGNVNNGLQQALATGRKPQFILLLDADFVAGRNILRRVLPLFHADDVGIVQTPQHFFNPDPIQINVFSPTVWPDEQRYFFNVLMPSLDAWGTACCCGTSAVLRVEALQAIGGMATETVTEDMLTSFKMSEFGWRTIYLDEPLSLGLAPEGVIEYIVQRSRWCLGGVQQIYTRWSFLGRGKLRWIDRLNHFSSMLYWGVSFPFRLMLLSTPALWWWTDVAAYNATTAALARAVLPYFFVSVLFNSVYSANRVLPLMSDVNQLVSSTAVIRSVTTGLIRPWGQPFKVTPKGINAEGVTIHWPLMVPFLIIMAFTLSGLLINLGFGSELRREPSYLLNVIWSGINIVLLAVTCMACIDQPRRRTDERFLSGERAVLRVPGQRSLVCTVHDISVGGASLTCDEPWPHSAESGTLWLDDGRLDVPFALVRATEDRLTVRFVLSPAQRAAMILKLFDVRYGHAWGHVSPGRALRVALKRLMA